MGAVGEAVDAIAKGVAEGLGEKIQIIEKFLEVNERGTIFDLDEENTQFECFNGLETPIEGSKQMHYLEYDQQLAQEHLDQFHREIKSDAFDAKDMRTWRVRARYITFKLQDLGREDFIELNCFVTQGRGDIMATTDQIPFKNDEAVKSYQEAFQNKVFSTDSSKPESQKLFVWHDSEGEPLMFAEICSDDSLIAATVNQENDILSGIAFGDGTY